MAQGCFVYCVVSTVDGLVSSLACWLFLLFAGILLLLACLLFWLVCFFLLIYLLFWLVCFFLLAYLFSGSFAFSCSFTFFSGSYAFFLLALFFLPSFFFCVLVFCLCLHRSTWDKERLTSDDVWWSLVAHPWPYLGTFKCCWSCSQCFLFAQLLRQIHLWS